MDLHRFSVSELAEGLAKKDFSSLEVVDAFLDRVDRFDPALNAFISVFAEKARLDAKRADDLRAKGDARPLLGVPMAHKDNLCAKGELTSCGSKMLSNFVSPYDATVVEKVADAGFVRLGKLNMDEFAMGSDNEKSYYGPAKNPWDTDRVPGGSSGGSAAAVAASLAPVATGSDTGGSIRQPASFCGVTGIKPTYGRVSRYGLIAYASSLDQAGSFGRSALDCAYLLEAMAGRDPKDSTSVDKPDPKWVLGIYNARQNAKNDKPLADLKIGVPSEYFADGLSDDVAKAAQAALQRYQDLGATLVDIHLTSPKITLATYYLLACAEASSNLSRFDGVRFGYRCQDPKDLLDLYTRSRSEGFGLEVQRRIIMGTYALSAGYFDAYYVKAQKTRRLIAQDFAKAFASCDLIATPTAPTSAYKIGAQLAPEQIYMGDVYTVGVNLAGLPAISHPVGLDAQNLPVGLQLISNHWREDTLFAAVDAYQQSCDHHKKTPPAFA